MEQRHDGPQVEVVENGESGEISSNMLSFFSFSFLFPILVKKERRRKGNNNRAESK